MEFVWIRLKYRNCLTINKVGRNSGLTLLWFEDVSLSISSYSFSHIDAMIHDASGKLWIFMGFYGNPIHYLTS